MVAAEAFGSKIVDLGKKQQVRVPSAGHRGGFKSDQNEKQL